MLFFVMSPREKRKLIFVMSPGGFFLQKDVVTVYKHF